MKNIIFAVGVTLFITLFGGCVNSGPAPQDVKLCNPDGRAVIIKDIYSLPLIENKKLKATEIVKVFFPKDDNVRMKCSMTLLKIPSGISPPKYKQTSAQIVYAISGGGKLHIESNMIILKKGVMVYVPPNTPMSITNNVDQILEIIVVTSPPFETSQMTVLEKAPKRVKVTKDSESGINDDDVPSQSLSEKYKAKQRNQRTLSVEEYRNRISKELLPGYPKGEDAISDLLKDDLINDKSKTQIKPKAEVDPKAETKKDSGPLKMPDSSKIPLKKLEEEQEEKLIPKKAQKIENVNLKHIQDLTSEEQQVPTRDENAKPANTKVKSSNNDQDSLEKLLNEQEEKKIKVSKVKKTSLKHVQELSPAEKAVPTKSDTNPKL